MRTIGGMVRSYASRALAGQAGPIISLLLERRNYFPLIVTLGIVASLMEGIGIGALIPLFSVLLSEGRLSGLPEPINMIGELTRSHSAGGQVLVLLGAVVGFMALKVVFQLLNSFVIARIHADLVRDLTDTVANRLLDLDFPFFLTNEPARLLNVTTTALWEIAAVFRALLTAIPAAVSLGVFGVILAWFNWQLFLLVLASSILVLIAMQALARRQRERSTKVMADFITLERHMLEIIAGSRTIRLFNARNAESGKFAAISAQVFDGVCRMSRLTGLVRPGLEFMLAAIFAVILAVATGIGMTIPEAIAYLVLLSRAQPYATALIFARSETARNRGSIGEVEWLLGHHPPSGRPAAVTGNPVMKIDAPIRFAHVSFTYPKDTHNDGDSLPAIEDVSFEIEPGVATALIGRSGAGKTTIVNLLGRLVAPSSGSISIGGTPLEAFSPEAIRSMIAVAGQDLELFCGSVAENIAFGWAKSGSSEIEEAAAAAGATEFIRRLPDGFDSEVGPGGARLSGGQRQRISLARALLRKPELLILDEATSAVDAISESEILDLLSRHQHFRTLLLISHRHSTLSVCRNGIVMEHGKIVEAGPLSGLNYYRTMSGGLA